VLADLKRKAPRSPSTRLNLVLFRLACCCGLRASEMQRKSAGYSLFFSAPAITAPSQANAIATFLGREHRCTLRLERN
jgi:hypothetical protein